MNRSMLQLATVSSIGMLLGVAPIATAQRVAPPTDSLLSQGDLAGMRPAAALDYLSEIVGIARSASQFEEGLDLQSCASDSSTGVTSRGLLSNRPWPRGEIFYDFTGELYDTAGVPDGEDNEHLAIFNTLTVMIFIEQLTGLQFIGYDGAVPEHFASGYVLVESVDGLGGGLSAVGHVARDGGTQTYQIDSFAWPSFGLLLHEFGHTIGLYHEAARADRDEFILVNFQNLMPGSASQFTIDENATTHGAYDFESIMHYTKDAFAWPGLDSITVLPPFDDDGGCMQISGFPEQCGYALTIGLREIFSDGDLAGIVFLYGPDGDGGDQWFWDLSNDCVTDVTLNRFVDSTDLMDFWDMVQAEDFRADLNFDGLYSTADIIIFYFQWLTELGSCDPRPGVFDRPLPGPG